MKQEEKSSMKKKISTVFLTICLVLSILAMPASIQKVNAEAESGFNKINNFYYTGAGQEFVVPASGVYSLECWGAGNGAQGGGYTYTEVVLKEQDTLYVYCGQKEGAFNGGADGAYHGSGATDIRVVPATGGWYDASHASWNQDRSLLSRIITSGGAGGTTYQTEYKPSTSGWQYAPNVNSNAYARVSNQNTNGQMGLGTAGGTASKCSDWTFWKWRGPGSGGGWYGGYADVHEEQMTPDHESYSKQRYSLQRWTTYAYGGLNYVQGDNGNGDTDLEDFYFITEESGNTKEYITSNTISLAGNEAMPSAHGVSTTMIGNVGNGFATITYLKPTMIDIVDITVLDTQDAVFSAYSADATAYTWYYYDTDDQSDYYNDWRKIGAADAGATSGEIEKSGRKFEIFSEPDVNGNILSRLRLMKTDRSIDDGLKVRCVASGGENFESTGTLKVMKNGYNKIIASYYKTIQAGSNISTEDILVALLYESGTPDFASGWNNLYFVVADEEGQEQEVKDITAEYGDNEIRVRLKDENQEPILDEAGNPVLDESGNPTYNDSTQETTFWTKGVDTVFPGFITVTTSEYELLNEDSTEGISVDITVTLDGADTYTKKEDLLYALKPKDQQPEESDFSGQAVYELSIAENITYTAYVRDTAGNTAEQDVVLTVRDNEDPVIVSKSLIFKEEEGWVTKNIIQVEATDNYLPEKLTYCFLSPEEITEEDTEENTEKTSEFGQWISENNIIITANGTYTIQVRDSVGNITTATIDVINIDGVAPEIKNIVINSL